jgi:hypothetical protein
MTLVLSVDQVSASTLDSQQASSTLIEMAGKAVQNVLGFDTAEKLHKHLSDSNATSKENRLVVGQN